MCYRKVFHHLPRLSAGRAQKLLVLPRFHSRVERPPSLACSLGSSCHGNIASQLRHLLREIGDELRILCARPLEARPPPQSLLDIMVLDLQPAPSFAELAFELSNLLVRLPISRFGSGLNPGLLLQLEDARPCFSACTGLAGPLLHPALIKLRGAPPARLLRRRSSS